MIKNIVIGVLVVIIVLMTLYGIIKAKEATKNAAIAAEQAALAGERDRQLKEQDRQLKEAVSNQANDIRTAFEQEMWAYQRLEAKYDSLLKVCNESKDQNR